MRNPVLTLNRAKPLRRPMTPHELGLWLRVKNRQLGGFKFRRQHPVGPYILDFYCAEVRLAVEIDGQAHWSPEQEAHDARRDGYLRAIGIETLRLSAESLKLPDAAAEYILEVVRRRVESRPLPLAREGDYSPTPAIAGGRANGGEGAPPRSPLGSQIKR